jgi:hypothetical protein
MSAKVNELFSTTHCRRARNSSVFAIGIECRVADTTGSASLQGAAFVLRVRSEHASEVGESPSTRLPPPIRRGILPFIRMNG